MIELQLGNSLEVLKDYPDNHFDAVVTDPPYGLGKEPDIHKLIDAWNADGYLEVKGGGFMNKEWDSFVPQPLFWKEVYRVLKSGGYLLSFFGTRTVDIGNLAISMSGFEIIDSFSWLYGSGFPKSYNISKGFDKDGNSELSEKWDGWGSALKPAHEPITIARKGYVVNHEIEERIRTHHKFIYCGKTSKSERNGGIENNNHPTVKPIKLMTELVNIATNKGDKILDPFMGSGSTGIACVKEGYYFVGIEMMEEYYNIAEKRIEHYNQKPKFNNII